MTYDFNALVKSKPTDELLEMLRDAHQFQPDMIIAVTDELNARNVDTTELMAKRTALYEENETLLSSGKEGNSLYLVICFIASILGGLLGIIGGYIYSFSKTTSLAGNRYYVYDKATRQWGRIIFWVGISCFLLAIMIEVGGSYGL